MRLINTLRNRPLLLAAALLTAGCHTLALTRAKSGAQQRWSGVRSRVQVQLAQQQYQSGLFNDAVRSVEEAVSLDPREADAYVLLAKANLELGRPASAEQAVEAAARAGLDSAALRYMRGVILEQRGAFEKAVADYNAARRLDPAAVDYLVAEAECLVRLDRAEDALRLLDENAHQYDDEATVATLTAHVASLLGDGVGAANHYRRALVTCKDSTLVAEELGRALMREGRYEGSLNLLEPVMLAGEPDGFGSVRRAVAACHLALGDPAAAREALAKYATAHEEDTLAQLLLAKAALALGDTMTALRAVDLVERREPNRPELWLVRAAVHWQRGNLTPAASDLYDYLRSRPDDLEANCLLAEVLHAKRQVDGARAYFEKALVIAPDFPWAVAGLESLNNPLPNDAEAPTPKLTASDPFGER